MAEHTFNIPSRQLEDSTRFDNGDELRFRAAGEHVSDLAAARALIARAEAERLSREAERSYSPQAEIGRLSREVNEARQQYLNEAA